ncbi:MAG: hypothetical protein K2K95_03515 [Muribaculaceae bacterium]|nr:hypothetical protein [Muribaculaceae bacterium]
MYYKTVKTPFVALIGAGICLLPACQDSTVESPDVPSDGASVTLKLTKFGSTTESTGSVDLLQFSGGVLRQKISATADQSDPVTFNRGDDNRIYAVSGWTLDVVPGKTTEETIAKAIINLKEGETAPIFFSAVASLDSVASTMSLELQRGVARIDISNSDSLLTVKEVIVENVPTASYLFPVEGEKYADASTTTHSRTFDENIWGLERGVFTIFESTQGATVKISGEN